MPLCVINRCLSILHLAFVSHLSSCIMPSLYPPALSLSMHIDVCNLHSYPPNHIFCPRCGGSQQSHNGGYVSIRVLSLSVRIVRESK